MQTQLRGLEEILDLSFLSACLEVWQEIWQDILSIYLHYIGPNHIICKTEFIHKESFNSWTKLCRSMTDPGEK